jgi:hypothetical protein
MGRRPSVVVEVVQTDGDCIVKPHECHAHRGDEVVWKTGKTGASIWIPHEKVFAERELNVPPGTQASLSVRSDAPYGRYIYAIFGHEARDFAHGSSHPIMIIDPGP